VSPDESDMVDAAQRVAMLDEMLMELPQVTVDPR